MRQVEHATLTAARALARAAWVQPSGQPYPDDGWSMVRGCTIALAFEAFAVAYGMPATPTSAAFPEIAALAEEALAAFRALPLVYMSPEHFGHVHEVLVGYGLKEGELAPTSGRGDFGAHFTPRALAHRMMRTTVKPVLRAVMEEHARRHAESLPAVRRERFGAAVLGLRICDPAVGGGAFLLALVRYLARFVFWSGVAPTMETAKHLVALYCAHGVDRDRYAVYTTQLALVLECRAPSQRAMVDALAMHIKHGDALVGLDREQLVSFNWRRGQPPVPAIEQLYTRAAQEAERSRAAWIAAVHPTRPA